MEFIKTFGTPSTNQELEFTETTNESIAKTRITKTLTRAEQSIQGDIRIIDEACFRWNIQEKRPKWNASWICSICLLAL